MIEAIKKREMAGHSGPVYAICEGRTSGMLLSASGDRFIAEWDWKTGLSSPFSVKLNAPCFAIACNINDQLLMVGTGEGNLHVIDLANKQELHNFKVHTQGIFSIVLIAEENLIVVAGGDGYLSVWEPVTWKLLRHFKVSDFKLRALHVFESTLWVGTSDGSLHRFDLPWLNELERINAHEGGCYCITHHPTKPLLITGGKDGHLRFWHFDANIRPFRAIPAHNFGIYALAFSPNGRWAVSASRDKSLKVWDASSFDPLVKIVRPKVPAHTHSVNQVMWMNEHTFVSTGDDRKLIVWEVTEHKNTLNA
jgi:WD40 repeat protein